LGAIFKGNGSILGGAILFAFGLIQLIHSPTVFRLLSHERQPRAISLMSDSDSLETRDLELNLRSFCRIALPLGYRVSVKIEVSSLFSLRGLPPRRLRNSAETAGTK
jgi:hypothetical protein